MVCRSESDQDPRVVPPTVGNEGTQKYTPRGGAHPGQMGLCGKWRSDGGEAGPTVRIASEKRIDVARFGAPRDACEAVEEEREGWEDEGRTYSVREAGRWAADPAAVGEVLQQLRRRSASGRAGRRQPMATRVHFVWESGLSEPEDGGGMHRGTPREDAPLQERHRTLQRDVDAAGWIHGTGRIRR